MIMVAIYERFAWINSDFTSRLLYFQLHCRLFLLGHLLMLRELNIYFKYLLLLLDPSQCSVNITLILMPVVIVNWKWMKILELNDVKCVSLTLESYSD